MSRTSMGQAIAMCLIAGTANADGARPHASGSQAEQGTGAVKVAAAGDDRAGGPAVSTGAATTATAAHGIALGIELGDPSSATAAWFSHRLIIQGAIGTGTLAGIGIAAHVDGQLEVHRFSANLPLRIGVGARFYHHGYQPASADELPDSHFGVRASAALAFERGPLELYAELAPGIDIKRTRSCTLADGPNTICPHAQALPVFLQFAVGARWFISR